MNVHYRVINTDPQNKRLVVRYWTDLITENSIATSKDVNGEIMLTSNGWPIRTSFDYSVDMYLTNANSTIETVKKNIEHYAPIGPLKEFERRLEQTDVVNTNFDLVNSLVNEENVFTYDILNPPLASEEIEKQKQVAFNRTVNTFIDFVQNNYNIIVTPKNTQ